MSENRFKKVPTKIPEAKFNNPYAKLHPAGPKGLAKAREKAKNKVLKQISQTNIKPSATRGL